MDDLNYFNCTLGEASLLGAGHQFETIPQLLKEQSENVPNKFAVGLPVHMSNNQHAFSIQRYTFKQLYETSCRMACALQSIIPKDCQNVALLAASGQDFLFIWLGLLQLGLPVLLIAPEVTAAGMANLLVEANATFLFHDQKHAQAASKVAELVNATGRQNTASSSFPALEALEPFSNAPTISTISTQSTAYIHHTSGTSSGLPKPIFISHTGAVGVVPVMKDTGATFTTTPLYHGGPADCFRAWTSSAMIYLFPGIGDVPITGTTVLKAVEAAQKGADIDNSVSYFTSVPYVLETLMKIPEGMDMLKGMELVGVGGAALSKDIGDVLAKARGVRLLSRYGSAECGFIMSSRRDYTVDTDWNFLRSYDHPAITFEPQSGPEEVCELVLKDWPFMAKFNRGEGTFATADCFKLHPNKQNRWLYHSRNDSQLALASGKKFDPAPLESSMMDALRWLDTIREVYVFGAGRLYPGLLLIRSERSAELKDAEMADQVWPVVETVNRVSPAHAQIKRHMLVFLPSSTPKLQKSSKGTLIRRQIDETFADVIKNAYHRQISSCSDKPLDLDGILRDVRSIVKNAVLGGYPGTIEDDQDLYEAGADSMVCMEIRDHLQRNYGQVLDHEFPMTIAYDCGNVRKLTDCIYHLYIGAGMTTEDEIQQVTSMLERFGPSSTFGPGYDDRPRDAPPTQENVQEQKEKDVVILTGATGTLGVHILHQLRSSGSVSAIHCLVRGASQKAATERLSKALSQKQLPPLEATKSRIAIHVCKLSDEPTMGLTQDTYDYLSQTATLTIHAAWSVNFNLPLRAFSDDLKGLRNLLSLGASSHRPSFLFCSSTASVLGEQIRPNIEECVSHNPKAASAMGYARSKWVAEAVCERIHESTGLPIAIARIGQLCGDEKTGTWNVTEAWPLMLASTSVTGALPNLNETLNWLKVDIAATAVIQIGFNLLLHRRKGIPVYHVINKNSRPEWSQMLDWIKQNHRHNLDILPPDEWVQRLEGGEDHAAKKLLGLWKRAYCNPKVRKERTEPTFVMEETSIVAPVLRDVQPLDEEYFSRVWKWVEAQM